MKDFEFVCTNFKFQKRIQPSEFSEGFLFVLSRTWNVLSLGCGEPETLEPVTRRACDKIGNM